MLMVGCLKRAPADSNIDPEVLYVVQDPVKPRLCLSPMPEAGRLRGDAPEAWRSAARHIVEGNLVGAQMSIRDGGLDHPSADALRGVIQLLSGDVDGARTLYRTLVSDYPQDACVQMTAAAIYMADRESVMARTHATDAWRLAPENPEVQYVYAVAWLQAGDESRATSALRKVIAMRPEHPGAGYLLGSDYLRRGHVDMAVPMLEVALAGGVDVSEPLAVAYFELGQLDEYVRMASLAGWPLGDGGAIGEAEDPGAAWRDMLGVSDGQSLWATFDTSMGELRCELFWQDAPLTVSSFVGLTRGTQAWVDPADRQLVSRPLYDGTIFHRVIPDFMIQAGDPLGTGAGNPGYRFRDEITSSRRFTEPGMLAMANSGPNTNGSQFFITDAPVPHLNGNHTIFGECDAASQEVVRQIARVSTVSADKPMEDVVIHGIDISSRP
jgi:peptidyl-prolyl cis-trans isomerase A (cyclophilin A)